MNDREKDLVLIDAIADLREEEALALVGSRLDRGDDALLVLRDCQCGMRRIGARYEAGEYFLSGLIMGGEIFRQIMHLLRPVVERQISDKASGTVLLGTVEGDIHDLGKNMVHMLLSCHNFAVHDLGVNVAPDEFVARARELRPDIIGLSGLLTSSYDTMRQTIAQLRAAGVEAPIIIGGGQLDDSVFHYVEADHWTTDAITGVELCQRLVRGRLAR